MVWKKYCYFLFIGAYVIRICAEKWSSIHCERWSGQECHRDAIVRTCCSVESNIRFCWTSHKVCLPPTNNSNLASKCVINIQGSFLPLLALSFCCWCSSLTSLSGWKLTLWCDLQMLELFDILLYSYIFADIGRSEASNWYFDLSLISFQMMSILICNIVILVFRKPP